MQIRDYIQATSEALLHTEDSLTVLENLKKYLHVRGLMKVYPRILRGVVERVSRNEKTMVPVVTLARASDFDTYADAILSSVTKVGGDMKNYTIHVDESIIGGFIVKGKSERIDTSYKNTLLHTYKRLTVID
jgi:F0F1-type ATP synthase delta subunit